MPSVSLAPARPLPALPPAGAPMFAGRLTRAGRAASEDSGPAGDAGHHFPREAKAWFALAVGSLVIAGLLSLSVVLGRLPILSGWINDPLFFKRCLVVHVDLALVVWFYGFLCGLSRLRSGPAGAAGVMALVLAGGGVALMLGGAMMRGAQPILANYVPVIDHPLFLGGLAAFFVGVALFLVTTLATAARRRPGGMPADAAVGLQAAALAVLLAAATWIATRASLPAGLDAWTRYEFSAWGAGHVLQVANASAMLAVWLWLLARATGRPLLSEGAARLVFGLLLAPHFLMPLLTARGAMDALYHTGATQLMRWGIFPVVGCLLVYGVRHLLRQPRADDPLAGAARAGFLASAGLTLLGFVLGACIRSSTTLVPAHYHASLGAVTVAFMTAAYLVVAAARRSAGGPDLERSRDPALPRGCVRERADLRSARFATSARRQLSWFGIGQSVFALGFAIGGVYGLGRKAYATEQHVRSAGEYVGLGVMGVGGLLAAAAGLWFLYLVLRDMAAWLRRTG